MSLPVVFLHGWGLHGGVWDAVAARLPGRTCRQPDLPGYGDAPSVLPYDADGLADALAASQPARCIVVGWSMGGMIAQAWAARRPAQVAALILVATSPTFVNRADWHHGMAPEAFAQFAADLAADHRATLLRFLALQARGGDAARETVARLRESLAAHGEPNPASLAAGLGLLHDVDLRETACRIATPTLVVHGGRDTVCPYTAGAWLADNIAGARLATHGRAAHAPFLSHPDWFADTVAHFLDDAGPAA